MADAEDDVEEKPVVAAGPADTAVVDLKQPPAAPAAAPTAPPIDSMIVTPEQQKALQDKLVAIKRSQMASNNAGASSVISQLHKDRAQMDEAYKATALPPDALQEWDAKAKRAEHTTDPVQAFGSIGSVFAMIAPMFARLPMEASLNAGAAALDAIHAGDDKAYERDYASWKDNTQLALKRHEIMRQAYNDSILKMNTDLNAGRSEMEMNARKFGDQQALTLLEAGLDGDLNKAINDRNKTALELQSTADKVWLEHEKVKTLRDDPNYQAGGALRDKAIQDHAERWQAGGRSRLAYGAESEAMKRYDAENPKAGLEDRVKYNMDVKRQIAEAENTSGGTGGGGKSGEVERRTQEYMKPTEEGGKGLDRTAAYNLASQEVATSNKAASTNRKTNGVNEIVAQSEKEVAAGTRQRPLTIAEAEAVYNRTAATPSGNRLDDIDKQIGQLENGISGIDRTVALIDKHVGAVGAAGYATRLGERLGNVLGSNETDRSQIAHDIQYLQTVAPRLLQDASSRGLKAEADKINGIIAGLNFGDTTANTKRALGEVRVLWDKIKQDNINRRRGIPSPTSGAGPANGGTPPASVAPPASSVPKWQQAPVVGPRSSLEDATAAT